jgi:hypothetical protein
MAANKVKRWTKANDVTFFGGIAGLAVFVAVGLLPSLLYGGYAGVLLGSAIFGTPIHENVLAQATVVLGVLAGVLTLGGIFVLGGAILATGIYGTVSGLARMRREEEAEEAGEVAEGRAA